ncbi:hypothetical protein thsps21_50570 [Pseudomonas sp. No.21]|nr:hypothetical protein TUM20249_43310 [Pseudomonas tohonis]
MARALGTGASAGAGLAVWGVPRAAVAVLVPAQGIAGALLLGQQSGCLYLLWNI